MKFKYVLPIVFFLIASCGFMDDDGDVSYSYSDQPDETETDSDSIVDEDAPNIDAIMADYSDGPGGAIMVVQDGEIVFQNGYGYANVENEEPITPDTVFHLGSVGKQFTAMAVMILSERGDVNLDSPIIAYLPELSWADDGVTVRSLLHHTSGIMGYDDSDELYDALSVSADMPGNSDLIRVLAENGSMLTEPGETFNYSNTGYDVLGAMIERVSGQTYAEFMNDKVFAPLGMSNTFALPSSRRDGPDVAESYSTEGAYEPDALDNINGSGSIYSTLGDFYLYDQALYTNELVSQAMLDEAFTPAELNSGESTGYGFGFDIAEHNGEAYVGHSGAWLGFESYYLRFAGSNLSVVVLLNLDYASGGGAEEIAFSVADLYLK